MKDKDRGWAFEEVTGVTIVDPILLLPKEERLTKIEAQNKQYEEFLRIGDQGESVSREDGMKPDRRVFCPFGCEIGAEIRTFRVWSTLIGTLSDDPDDDPNCHSMSCLCKGCEKRFIKHWRMRDCCVVYKNEESREILAGKTFCRICG